VRALKKLGAGRPSKHPLVLSVATAGQLDFLVRAEELPLEDNVSVPPPRSPLLDIPEPLP
jgi:hypothetical protein